MEYMELAVAEDGFGIVGKAVQSGTRMKALQKAGALRHGPTAVSLPSASLPDKSLTALAESLASDIKEIDKAFEKGTDTYLLNRYILTHFNSRTYKAKEEHFFNSEAEYILGGELTDRKNEKRVEMALKAMRFPLQILLIYTAILPEKGRNARYGRDTHAGCRGACDSGTARVDMGVCGVRQ